LERAQIIANILVTDRFMSTHGNS